MAENPAEIRESFLEIRTVEGCRNNRKQSITSFILLLIKIQVSVCTCLFACVLFVCLFVVPVIPLGLRLGVDVAQSEIPCTKAKTKRKKVVSQFA